MKKVSSIDDVHDIYGDDIFSVDLGIPNIINLLMREAKSCGCHLIYLKPNTFTFSDYRSGELNAILNKLII